MPWVKLDDGFSDNEKVILAGKDGRALYITALCHSARQLTDGLIREPILPILAVKADIENVQVVVNRLVEVGLWETVDGGYIIHDYLEYNPTAESVRHQREGNARRQAEWRARTGRNDDGQYSPLDDVPGDEHNTSGNSNAVSNAVTNNARHTVPVPVPVPVPSPDPRLKVGNTAQSGADAPAAGPQPEKSSPPEPKKRKKPAQVPKSAAVEYLKGRSSVRLNNVQCEAIDAVVEKNLGDLQKWKTVVDAWLSSTSRNPGNVIGMLDWYKQGVPAYAQPGYKPPRRDNGSTKTDRGASELSPDEEERQLAELKRRGFKRADLAHA